MSLKIHKYQHIRQNSKLFSAYSSVFLSNSNKKFSLSFLPYTANPPETQKQDSLQSRRAFPFFLHILLPFSAERLMRPLK